MHAHNTPIHIQPHTTHLCIHITHLYTLTPHNTHYAIEILTTKKRVKRYYSESVMHDFLKAIMWHCTIELLFNIAIRPHIYVGILSFGNKIWKFI